MHPFKRLAVELHDKHCDSMDGMSRCFWENNNWASAENAGYLTAATSLLDYLSLENALKVSDIFYELH